MITTCKIRYIEISDRWPDEARSDTILLWEEIEGQLYPAVVEWSEGANEFQYVVNNSSIEGEPVLWMNIPGNLPKWSHAPTQQEYDYPESLSAQERNPSLAGNKV